MLTLLLLPVALSILPIGFLFAFILVPLLEEMALDSEAGSLKAWIDIGVEFLYGLPEYLYGLISDLINGEVIPDIIDVLPD